MENKKRILGIAIGLALVASLLFGGVVLADGPTVVTVNWDGTGVVTGGAVCDDDSHVTFLSSAADHEGTFTATDQNNNPYSYGVDSCVFTLEDTITGGGVAYLWSFRDDSHESMYGPAGQESYTYVLTADGTATLQNRSSTNFAEMKDCNYGWHSSNQITVSGSSAFILDRWVKASSGEYAELMAQGAGSANLNCMSSEAYSSSVNLGSGCGCYTNASFTATGAGRFDLWGVGETSATTAMAPGMTGADSFHFIATWSGGSTFTVPDYHASAH